MFCSERAGGRNNEYVYHLTEIYQVKSEVTTKLYRVPGCLSWRRKFASRDLLSPANIKSRAYFSPT